MTWYAPTALRPAFELPSRLQMPTDWVWHDFTLSNRLAMLGPA